MLPHDSLSENSHVFVLSAPVANSNTNHRSSIAICYNRILFVVKNTAVNTAVCWPWP